ncbi:TlpA family protein disulfide reductase [Halobacillus shinanisalinarum]|uniref:TlpA family protein disulfide reductase n=1 Tax=Halobacillus shinanisalinarum TaxID=2932258 RepID=A0ABY4GYZ0_9BACI|nr:TlpA disulfide reductase family protein [Halobacillus shinanisalinarum]UOQ93123.1 TlpA family protein disulfide reductase [Halobacillus shinanisalinarum]
MKKKVVVQVLVGLSLITLIIFAIYDDSKSTEQNYPEKVSENSQLREGDKFPVLSLDTLEKVKKDIDFKSNKITLVNLWATWCPPCQKEMPLIEKYYNEYLSKGFNVVAISMGEGRIVVENYIEDHSLLIPVLIDPKMVTQNKLGVHGIPTSFFVNSEGIIIQKHNGELTEPQLKRIINSNL